MDKTKVRDFFLKARTKTYAGGKREVRPVFPKLHQLEYKEKDFLYRDVYNMGNGIFMGLETVYFKNKPVISMSYFDLTNGNNSSFFNSLYLEQLFTIA